MQNSIAKTTIFIRKILPGMFFLLCLLAFVPGICASAGIPADKVVALVNGTAIYEKQITAAVENRVAQYRQMGSKLPDDKLRRQAQLKELDGVIAQVLLSQAAAGVDQKIVDERVDKRPSSHAAAPGSSIEDRERLRSEMRLQILLEQNNIAEPVIGDGEARAFYEKNPKSFQVARSIKAQHILVRLPSNATSIQTAEARAKAEKLLSELTKGKSFTDVARASSDCSSKENGGDLGVIKEGFMPREFDAVAFNLKPGETSGLVKTRYGFHIIRVNEQLPARQMLFEEVKNHIINYLKLEQQRKQKDQLVNELRKSAKIEILI